MFSFSSFFLNHHKVFTTWLRLYSPENFQRKRTFHFIYFDSTSIYSNLFSPPSSRETPSRERTCAPKLNQPHDASSRQSTLKIQFSSTAQTKRRNVSLHFLHFVSHRNSRDVRMKILLHHFPMNFYVSRINSSGTEMDISLALFSHRTRLY